MMNSNPNIRPKIGDFLTGADSFEEIVEVLISAGSDVYRTDKGMVATYDLLSPVCMMKLPEDEENARIVWDVKDVGCPKPYKYAEEFKRLTGKGLKR